MHLYIWARPKGSTEPRDWLLVEDENIRKAWTPTLQTLRFMMACDVGWTGMIWEGEGAVWKWEVSPQHVVDVRPRGRQSLPRF